MASNFFGDRFRITTFGESHGPLIGVVIDGCPGGLPLTPEEIGAELALRKPGMSPFTSPRQEPDLPSLVSGIYEGKTTGAPLTILIHNRDADSSAYESMKHLYRPGHANFTYLQKYGVFDPRGGGRASARETAVRVAAGAVAKKLLKIAEIRCAAYVSQIGNVSTLFHPSADLSLLRAQTYASPLYCPDPEAERSMGTALQQVMAEGDSLGGVVSCVAHIPAGLGDPIYRKLEALLAYAMLTLPASKGFEIGSGFGAVSMRGSEHNDLFDLTREGVPSLKTNHAGGTLGGISTGAPLLFRVAFKPPSTIQKEQSTVNLRGEKETFLPPAHGRHDPCVAIRAVPVVEAMTALVLIDALLAQKSFDFFNRQF